MRGRRSRYELSEIRRLVSQGRYTITRAAQEGADALNIQSAGIVECVGQLTPADFYKTMPAQKAPGLWQDVYRPRYRGNRLYVKLQISRAGNVVVSFKRL